MWMFELLAKEVIEGEGGLLLSQGFHIEEAWIRLLKPCFLVGQSHPMEATQHLQYQRPW